MTEPNSVPVVTIDGKHYSVESLGDDAKALVECLRENQVLQAHHIAQHRQLQIARELLSAKLNEMTEGVEPLEVNEPEEQVTPVSITEAE